MREVKIKKYLKKMDYSYTLGVYPTIELLETKPKEVSKVLISTKFKGQNLEKLIALCRRNQIRFEFNDAHIQKIAFKEHTLAVGIFMKYRTKLDVNKNHIMLDNPSDMGNLGTIIRTMAGFGFENLAIIEPAADIFDPKVIRSSMGGFFKVNFEHFEYISEYLDKFPNHNLYPFMLEEGKSIEEVTFEQPFTLVFGNEGQGLDKIFTTKGTPIFIPQTKKIDSLNLGVAAGIAMYRTTLGQ